MQTNSYRVNTPHVVYENFADEVIAVSFLDGSYYSIRGAGIEIWKLLCVGGSKAHILAAFQEAYPNDPGLQNAIVGFMEELLQRNLIVATEESAASDLPVIHTDPTGLVPPVLETYTDMQDLLLLDPIHEVGEDGWPKRTTAPSSASANE